MSPAGLVGENGFASGRGPERGRVRVASGAAVPAAVSTQAAVAALCAHCGLPVPIGLVESGAAEQFCCAACRTVHAVIHGGGLDEYYRIRAQLATEAAPAKSTGQRYSEYDDPAFRRAYCRPCGERLETIDLLLEGVHCGACVWLLEKLPRLAPGVIEARLNLRRARLRLTWSPDTIGLAAIARKLDSLGYPPHPARGASVEALRKREDRRQLVRLAIAGACAGNAMLLAFALYAGATSGMEPVYATLLRYASALVGAVAVGWPGAVFFRSAWAALRTRTMHIDVPIALGLAVGSISGLVNTVVSSGDIYFDSVAMLVFLLLVARFVQGRQQRHAADAVELLFSLTPTRARRVRGEELEDVAVESLQRGDVVEVRAQESVPVDGRVLDHAVFVDQSLLTGESQAVCVGPDERVHAGAVNLSGRMRVAVEATGEQTRVGKLMTLVAEALRKRTPIVQLMDRIAGRFVLAVIVLALATLAGWLIVKPGQAVDRTIALLIVACPCALGLATPLAIAAAVGRAARRGILIKGGAALEQLAHPGLILLDKTGTVTRGQMKLVRWQSDEALQPLVAALESRSTHPVARTLCAALGAAGSVEVADAVQNGNGIRGIAGGRSVAVGSRGFVREIAGLEPAWVQECAGQAEAAALTPVFVAVDGRWRAFAALGDELRPDAAACISQLRADGWSVGLLSGDSPEVVSTVAAQLGIAPEGRRGGMTPEQKLRVVHEQLRRGPVVMVGDGVNDAAALAAATVGIAVHGGAEASFAAADVYLSREGLAPVIDLMKASRRTLTAIRRCLLVSLAYNAAGVALAGAGLVTPLVAALLMPASSITVVSLALAVRTFGKRTCP